VGAGHGWIAGYAQLLSIVLMLRCVDQWTLVAAVDVFPIHARFIFQVWPIQVRVVLLQVGGM
jgi:nicotinamide riboside transporter PnuC